MAKNKAGKPVVAAAPLDPVLAALAQPEVPNAVAPDTAPDLGTASAVDAGAGAQPSEVPEVADEEADDGSTGYGQSNEPEVPVLLNSPDTVVNILAAPVVAPEASLTVQPEDVYPEPEEAPVASQGVPANPALLQWPSDQYGTCSAIKQPLLDCIGGLNGQPEKLEVFLLTMQMATEHALARFENQRSELQASLEWHQKQEAIRNGSRHQKGWQS